MMLEKLLAPFTNKGKQVSLEFSEDETGTEICNRKNGRGPTGTGFATDVRDTCSTACGCQKGCIKNPVTTVQPRRWSAPSPGFGFPTGNGGISQERGCTPEKEPGRGRVRC